MSGSRAEQKAPGERRPGAFTGNIPQDLRKTSLDTARSSGRQRGLKRLETSVSEPRGLLDQRFAQVLTLRNLDTIFCYLTLRRTQRALMQPVSFSLLHSRPGIRVAVLLLASCGVVLLLDIALSQNCAGPTLLTRRDCLLLRTPLVWLAPERTVSWREPETVQPLTVPPDADPTAIKGNTPDDLENVLAVAQTNRGGYVALLGTWSEQASDDNSLYVIDNGAPFVGQFELGSFEPNPRTYAISCLVDFIQRPCTPDTTAVQMVTLNDGQLVVIPIRIDGLEQGLHDLTVVFERDPLLDHDEGQPEARWVSTVMAIRASIAVGGDTTPVDRPFKGLPAPLHAMGMDGLAASKKAMPWNRMGGVQQDALLSATPEQEIQIYLHLSNSQPIQVDLALSAFLDNEQIPIEHRRERHAPLYVSAKSQAQYVIPVKITAPTRPGQYELVFYGQPFPEARMDLTRETLGGHLTYGLGIDMWSSYKISLVVKEE